MRDFIGPASMDAAALTRHRRATMYADDLGLRRLFNKGARGRSFSTVGLVRALADVGLLTEDVRDRHLLRMAENRYATIPPAPALLEYAVWRAPELPRGTLARAFALIAGPAIAPADAARLSAGVLRVAATAAVQTLAIADIVELGLTAMAERWPAPTCARLLSAAAADTLALLPTHLQHVRRACAAFVRRHRSGVLGIDKSI